MACIFIELEVQGAHNINLVTSSHHTPHVIAAIKHARDEGLTIPVVYNTSGYESIETLAMLAEVVDVWLTDFKYSDSELARRYSNAQDYPLHAAQALRLMHEHVQAAGGRSIGDDGTLQKGLIVRHLVLPEAIDNALQTLDIVYEICGTQVDVSIMNQYTPTTSSRRFGRPLDRAITAAEYERVLDYADDLDFQQVWWQEGETVSESFIPLWDCEGV